MCLFLRIDIQPFTTIFVRTFIEILPPISTLNLKISWKAHKDISSCEDQVKQPYFSKMSSLQIKCTIQPLIDTLCRVSEHNAIPAATRSECRQLASKCKHLSFLLNKSITHDVA